ncbi:MAG: hypothetical protein OXI94_10115 [Gemmatimonadota bacterium]|nr:hypothetical protein [Gemmatimonadota bacterium]MYK18789.1 hypothetical protein [Candidatus Poribacteria bacterium]
MQKSRGAVQMSPLYIILPFLLFLITGSISAIAETSETDTNASAAESDAETQEILPLFRNYMAETERETESTYPLFRSHAERYYPELDVKKATQLSTLMPGLGQAYAGNYMKATLFLSSELGAFALAGYNVARALHYNKQNVFETGFLDARTGEFLTYEQGRTRMWNHTFFSGMFLATGIGLHIWNILDAPKTAEAYNSRRFSVEMQQTDSGVQSLMFTHRF